MASCRGKGGWGATAFRTRTTRSFPLETPSPARSPGNRSRSQPKRTELGPQRCVSNLNGASAANDSVVRARNAVAGSGSGKSQPFAPQTHRGRSTPVRFEPERRFGGERPSRSHSKRRPVPTTRFPTSPPGLTFLLATPQFDNPADLVSFLVATPPRRMISSPPTCVAPTGRGATPLRRDESSPRGAPQQRFRTAMIATPSAPDELVSPDVRRVDAQSCDATAAR
jgi:hypothetical protein